MPALVSVITAFGRPEYDYLSAAGATVRALHDAALARTGDGVQWVVGLDGASVDEGTVRQVLRQTGVPATVTRNTTGVPGPGPARTCALAAVTGTWVHTLDADDLTYPDGVLALVAAAVTASVRWAAGRCDDLVDGQAVAWDGPDPFDPGPVPAGAVLEFKERTGAIPFILNATVVHVDLLRAVGGWPVRPMARSEDTALWATMTGREPGVWTPVPVFAYRRHAASITGAPGFRRLPEDLAAIAAMARAGSTRIADATPDNDTPDGMPAAGTDRP